MPRVNIYIRKEDEAKWRAISDKPDWLHSRLNESQTTPKPITRPTEVTGTPVDFGLVSLCEHYQPKGRCLVRGCKFA